MERSPQQVNFITLPSKDFTCPVCLLVLQDPFLTTCCGGHFCEGCVQKVKTQFDECPLCKEKPLNAVIDKYFKRQLDQLMIYCPQKECKWTGELGKVNEHLAIDRIAGECQYVNVKCPLSCGLEILRKLLDSHVAEDCPYRSTSCLYCDFTGSHMEVTTQHRDVCPNYPCTCPNSCSPTIIKRHKMSEHLAQCPEQEIPCAFLEMGCTKVMRRKQLQEHLEMSSTEHQLLTCKAFTAMKLETQQKIQAMQQQHQSEIATIREELVQVESQAGQAEYWVNGFRLMAEEVKKNNWNVYLSRMSELVSSMSPPIAPIIINLPNVTSELSKGIPTHSKLTYSTPFYTHPQGYKMLLYAKMANHNSALDQARSFGGFKMYSVVSIPNITVGFCIVKGEYDESLRWPLQGKATILLFNNQEDDNHREVIYNFTATRCIDQPIHCATKPVSAKKSAVISSRKEVRHQPYHFKVMDNKLSSVCASVLGSSLSLDHHRYKPVEPTDGAKFSYDKNDNCFKGDNIYFKVTIEIVST